METKNGVDAYKELIHRVQTSVTDNGQRVCEPYFSALGRKVSQNFQKKKPPENPGPQNGDMT